MANTLTSINDTKIMSSVVGALKLGLTPLSVFSLGVGSDPASKNENVYVPLVTARTASTNATNYQDGNTTVVGKQVNLSANISASWHMTAIEASKTSTDAFEKSGVECAYSIAYAAQLAAIDLIVRGTYTATEQVIASTALDSDAMFDLRNVAMNTQKWRAEQSPSCVLDGAYYANLGKDPAAKDLSASGGATAMTGRVPVHAGFNIHENGVISASTPYGATEYLRGFICLPQAMALGIRPPTILGQDGFEVNEIAAAPDSDIALNYRR